MPIRTAARSAVLGLTAAATLCATARADEALQSFKALVGQGFQVMATSVVPPEGQGEVDYTTIVITLQKGKSVAVCTFALANWESMNDGSLSNAQNCDVRSF
jgi:hypothetical protein